MEGKRWDAIVVVNQAILLVTAPRKRKRSDVSYVWVIITIRIALNAYALGVMVVGMCLRFSVYDVGV